MEISIFDLQNVYEEEIRKNVRNKKKTFMFERNKIEYLINIKKVLEENKYDGGRYNVFLVYKPKIRVISSQGVYDKTINHYVAKYILIPKFEKYLSKRNCATRKNMGSSYAMRLLKKDIESFKKYETFYILKMDISKYFYNIDHEILKSMLKNELTSDEYKLVSTIIDSTNKEYLNKKIEGFENILNKTLPKYNYGKGLPIGNMTSQFLAILYLYKIHHFITNNLKVKFVNYMDDYVLIHESKEYLKEVLKILKEKLHNEYKLDLNMNKTKIVNCKEGIEFIGYHIKVINKKTIINLCAKTKQNIKKGIKKSNYLLNNNRIDFGSYFSSIESYKNGYIFVDKIKVRHILDRYM